MYQISISDIKSSSEVGLAPSPSPSPPPPKENNIKVIVAAAVGAGGAIILLVIVAVVACHISKRRKLQRVEHITSVMAQRSQSSSASGKNLAPNGAQAGGYPTQNNGVFVGEMPAAIRQVQSSYRLSVL